MNPYSQAAAGWAAAQYGQYQQLNPAAAAAAGYNAASYYANATGGGGSGGGGTGYPVHHVAPQPHRTITTIHPNAPPTQPMPRPSGPARTPAPPPPPGPSNNWRQIKQQQQVHAAHDHDHVVSHWDTFGQKRKGPRPFCTLTIFIRKEFIRK